MAAIPRMMYGTAWKKDRTTELVISAVRAGFRAIDTAGQRKHYRQDLVGKALATVMREDGIKREELFIQTKYTSMGGQDAQGFIPYDPKASLKDQVTASFENSLKELQTSYIDSYLLHGPERTIQRNVEALTALQPYLASNKLRYIGISNIYDIDGLAMIQEELKKQGMKLSFVQNRVFEDVGLIMEMLAWCKENGVIFQSFWTLTYNRHMLKNAAVTGPAARLSLTPEQTFYQYCMQEGICPLNGTTNAEHMKLGVQVLQGNAGELTSAEVDEIRKQLYSAQQ